MDARERTELIDLLYTEAFQSMKMALRASRFWNARSADLKKQHGDDTPQLYIAKRDDLRLKEYMAQYVWHRDNSGWARTMIDMLKEEQEHVRPRRQVPSQR